MNGNQRAEVHYVNTEFPYMDLFEGFNYFHTDLALAEALQDQESAYWSLQTYSDRQGIIGTVNSSSSHGYTEIYGGNWQVMHSRDSTGDQDHQAQLNNDETLAHALQNTEDPEDITHMMAAASIGECNRGHRVESSSSQGIWQDNIDPDNMTYEELVELGEAVGTHSRGLSLELIALLPVSKYKTKFFSRRKCRDDRCVICHVDYKRGERMITLPCKHPYHATCITRWLQINKACPVCYVEVFGS